MVPFCDIELDDINYDLKRHNNYLEVKVEDEIALGNTILLCDDCFFIEDPKESDEEDRVEEGHVVIGVALEFTERRFYFLLDQTFLDPFLLFLL